MVSALTALLPLCPLMWQLFSLPPSLYHWAWRRSTHSPYHHPLSILPPHPQLQTLPTTQSHHCHDHCYYHCCPQGAACLFSMVSALISLPLTLTLFLTHLVMISKYPQPTRPATWRLWSLASSPPAVLSSPLLQLLFPTVIGQTLSFTTTAISPSSHFQTSCPPNPIIDRSL